MFKEKHAIQIVDSIERMQEGKHHEIKIEYLSLSYEDKLSRVRKMLDILNKDNGFKLIIKREDQNELNVFYDIDKLRGFNYSIKDSKNNVICYFYLDARVLFSNDYKDGYQIDEIEYGIGTIEPVLLDKKFRLPQITIFNNQYQNFDVEPAYRSFQIIEEFNKRLNLKGFPRNIKRMTLKDLKNIHPNEIFVYDSEFFNIQVPINLIARESKNEYFYNLNNGFFNTLGINNANEINNYIKYIEHIHKEVQKKSELFKMNMSSMIFLREGIPLGPTLIDLNAISKRYRDYIPQINMRFTEDEKDTFLRIKINYQDIGKKLEDLPLSMHSKNPNYIEDVFSESLYLDKFLENKEYYFGILSTLDY